MLIGLLLVYTLGDGITALWLRIQEARAEPPDLLADPVTWQDQTPGKWRPFCPKRPADAGDSRPLCSRRAWFHPMDGASIGMSFITLRDRSLMANVTEWNSTFTLPFVAMAAVSRDCRHRLRMPCLRKAPAPPIMGEQEEKFPAPPLLGAGGAAWPRFLPSRRSFGEALLHARNMSLFAVGSLVIAAPHFTPALQEFRRHLGLSRHPKAHGPLIAAFALFAVAALASVSFVQLRKSIGPHGYSPAGIGEAVAQEPSYPEKACAFMEAERFPVHLRLLNDFETGGYLLWRLPAEPVFIDGRLDVYVGRTFDDMLLLTHAGGSPARTALLHRYDFDCVLTASRREAGLFGDDPQWQKVYSHPQGISSQHYRIFLRRRPQFAGLIARCLQDQPIQP